MRSAALLSFLVLGLAGCQATGARVRDAELKTGPRFDDGGKFTDSPEATIPLWSSDGIKDRAPATIPSAGGAN